MRRTVRSLGLVLVSMLATIGLAIGSAFTAALAYGAVALIVPGTGTPNANIVTNYREHARDYYMGGTACSTSCTGDDLVGVNYPASFFPLVIFPSWCRSGPQGCDKWDDSVGQGADGGTLGPGLSNLLKGALTDPEKPDIVVFGYSQGGAVVSKVLNDYDWQPGDKQRVQVVTIGGIENPDGGLWQRLAFLQYIPFLDITFDPPMPVDPELKTTTIGFEYDPVVYAPRYFGNPLALLNAVAALETVHGTYLEPNGNDGDTPGALAYGYTPPDYVGSNPNPIEDQLNCTTHPDNCRYDGPNKTGNTYIMIPATSLPMYDLVLNALPAAVKPFVKPFVDLVTPVTKVLVDLGYDWSGNPGVPTPLSILPFNPFQNWLAVGANLIGASVQGVQAFAKDLGGLTTSATTLAPTTTSTPQMKTPQTLLRLASGPVQDDPSMVDKKEDKPYVEQDGKQDVVVENLANDKKVEQNTVDQAALDKAAADNAAAEAAAAKAAADEAAAAAAAKAAAEAAQKKAAAEAAEQKAAKAAEQDANDAADKARSEAAEAAKNANGAGTTGKQTDTTDAPSTTTDADHPAAA